MNKREIEEYMRARDSKRLKEDIELLKNAHNINKEFLEKNRSARSFLEETSFMRKDPLAKEALQSFIDLRRDPNAKEALQALVDLKRDSSMKGLLQDLLEPKHRLVDDVKAFLMDKAVKADAYLLRPQFISELSVSIESAIASSDNGEEALSKVESIVEEKWEAISSYKLSREAYLYIVLALIFFLCGKLISSTQFIELQQSPKAQKIVTEKTLQQQEETPESVSTNSIPRDNCDIYYVVRRNTQVKAHQKFKSLTIGGLARNTKVRLLKRDHKWLYIEYIDYFETVPKNGWVSKKYLKRLESR